MCHIVEEDARPQSLPQVCSGKAPLRWAAGWAASSRLVLGRLRHAPSEKGPSATGYRPVHRPAQRHSHKHSAHIHPNLARTLLRIRQKTRGELALGVACLQDRPLGLGWDPDSSWHKPRQKSLHESGIGKANTSCFSASCGTLRGIGRWCLPCPYFWVLDLSWLFSIPFPGTVPLILSWGSPETLPMSPPPT